MKKIFKNRLAISRAFKNRKLGKFNFSKKIHNKMNRFFYSSLIEDEETLEEISELYKKFSAKQEKPEESEDYDFEEEKEYYESYEESSGKGKYVLYTIIGSNIFVFFYVIFAFDEKDWKLVPRFSVSLNSILNERRISTFFTSMFLHGSIEHIGMNMLYLYLFGRKLIVRTGVPKFMMLYFIGGFFAGCAFLGERYYYYNQAKDEKEREFMYNNGAIGASGAVYSVLAANVLYGLSGNYLTWIVTRAIFFEIWNLIQNFKSRGKSPIGHSAHVGGALIGSIFVAIEFLSNFI